MPLTGTAEAANGKARRKARTRDIASKAMRQLAEQRIAIENVSPQIDGGRFAVKRVIGDALVVEADIFCDGHERIHAALIWRASGESDWRETPMRLVGNDRWIGRFDVEQNALHHYTIIAWRDLFESWLDEVEKKRAAGRPLDLEAREGAQLVLDASEACERGAPEDWKELADLAEALRAAASARALEILVGADCRRLMARVAPRASLTTCPTQFPLWVDRERAGFSAWYEMFPRSQSDSGARHGTWDDVIAKLPYVRDMGFDVLYFPPIHPIGKTNRKGRNNALSAEEGDPGSPYAIGSEAGGHEAMHPELGSFDDFVRLIDAAAAHGLEIALDFAIQCSPDHPWIRQHPEWFDWRPDGTIKYAENPPKKYEDIVNVHFYRDAFPSLWFALRDIVLFWAERGVRIFRVDNPHTKPYPFWEWLIAEVHERFPDALFLAEAFTRPKAMKRLAKLGFSQSYTYFTWRNAKWELREYLTELTAPGMRDYYRPNFFVNTPDINPHYLQTSGRSGFRARLALAATLACNFGVYSGFELCEGRSLPGKEEYLDSEKYELKTWDWDRPGHIRADIALINRLRRERPALRQFSNLFFYNCWNEEILYFGKCTDDKSDFVLVAVNLDPHNAQGGHFEAPLWEFGLPDDSSIDVEDLTNGERFSWHGKIQHIYIDPHDCPYRVWRLLPAKPGAGA